MHAFGKLATRVGALEPAAAELPRAEGFVAQVAGTAGRAAAGLIAIRDAISAVTL